MKTILLISIGLFFGISVYGQDYYERFKKLVTSKDTLAQSKLLKEWNKKNSNDPELYTCYFNYYVQRSLSEIVRLDGNPRSGVNSKDSSNQVVGYIYSDKVYNRHYLNLAFNVIDKGITKFPNRLDMRFGKTHILGQSGNYEKFTDEIIKTIDYSTKNKNAWQWTTNEPVEEPKEFLLENIQIYVGNLFDLGTDQAKNIRRIAETTLKIYPDHIISLSNLGISYIFEKNYLKALNPLLTAEKKSPKDAIILGNIAHVYLNLKDNKKAIEYYKKVMQFGDDNAKSFSQKQLKKLGV